MTRENTRICRGRFPVIPEDGTDGGTMTGAPSLALVTTSWDDGHPLDLRVADLLGRYGITGTFYVPKQASWPVMSSAEIRNLSSRFEIGPHLLEHRALDRLMNQQAQKELSGSRR